MKNRILPLIAFCIFSGSALAQSVLTTPLETPAETTARRTVMNVQQTKSALIGALRHSVETLWGSPDPAGALVALGPHAAEVIGLYQSLTTYLTSVLTAAGDTAGLTEVAEITARVPVLTTHEDGTVTIDPTPTPTPSPTP